MPGDLQGYTNAQDAVDQIRLSLNSPTGNGMVYALVEGKYDCCLYPKFFNLNIVSFEFVGGGKGQVELALIKLQDITKQSFGICDADFRHLTKEYPAISNLFFTDCHDIEMTMLYTTGVLENVLAAYNESKNSNKIIDTALKLAEIPAYIRLYNERNIIKVDFGRVKLDDVLTAHNTDAKLNIQEYIQKLNTCSKNKTKSVTEQEIMAFMQDILSITYTICATDTM